MSVKRYEVGAVPQGNTANEDYFISIRRDGRDITECDLALTDAHTIVDELNALLAATQWRPIETAPKDGTHVLAFHNGSIWTVWWSDTQMWHDSNDYDYRPTHWMPLPKPPSV